MTGNSLAVPSLWPALGRPVRLAISTIAFHPAAAMFFFFVVANSFFPCAAASAESESMIKIAFAGDSLADNYWASVTRIVAANSCLKNNLELCRFARNATGLSRGDRVYWPREIKRIGDTFKPKLFVLSIGINDRQFIDGGRTAWGAPDWTDKYRHEIIEFLKGSVASKTVVLWVGLPAMRDSVDNTDAIEKNNMFSEAIARISTRASTTSWWPPSAGS
jgi:hypothetical protein